MTASPLLLAVLLAGAPAAPGPAAVLDAALQSRDPKLKAIALEALGVSRRADALGVLSRELDADKGDLRFSAARGMAYLGDPAAAPALAKAWKYEKGWAVKKELAAAAGACKATSLGPQLQEATFDGHKDLAVAAAFALADLGDPEAGATLERLGRPERKGQLKEGTDRWSVKVLDGTKEGDRKLAARTLARVATEEHEPVLRSLLSDPLPEMRLWGAAGVLRLRALAPPTPP